MCGRSVRILVALAVLGVAAAQVQGASPYDRVAYYDAASGTAWAGDGGTVRDALAQAGYKVVNATELKAWMDARIADGKLSVVVMCRDVVPASVVETVTANCTIRRYLDAGGKVVWYSDWPFYYVGTTGNSPGGNGAVQVLGFNASSGPNDGNQQVTITEIGYKWGLTTPWNSTRPTSPTITPNLTVLASDRNGNAAGWVKHYLPGDTFRGFVRIDDHSGAPVNIPQLMAVAEYYEMFTTAGAPVPGDGATDIPRDTSVSWLAGELAVGHDVYFGTEFADVNSASRANPKGVLVSQGQPEAAFTPSDLLEYGQTYYWRVDEVNAAPDNTIFKGQVWSFTVEPYAYPITSVTASASSEQAGMTAQNTVNGAGLNASDQHSTESTQMWMSAGVQPNWIQFQFDKAYKLDELWVWNSNQLIEAFIGFGAKTVTIEYSMDGQTWETLEGVPEFARASGSATYTANTVVDFGGVTAQYVKLTIEANWGGLAQTGLAEVRFFYVPAQAREPVPADGAAGIAFDATLNWRPGRDATSHTVYFGADSEAVTEGTAPASTVTDHRFTPSSMEFGATYYWRVDEVGDGGTYAGDIWSFTSQEFAAIDDFEAYNDDDKRIYNAWVDGVTTQASGSQVGYDESPFAEKSIVHGGSQSMPMMYDNTASPYYSEAEFGFDTPTNLTVSGAQNLRLFYRGVSPSFVQTASGNILMNGLGADIWGTSDQFRFAYKSLSGNGSIVARVNSLFNSNTWAKAGVMIRQNTEPGSTHAFMAKTAVDGNGASFQRRLVAAGESSNNDAPTAMLAPYWVKIDRTGDKFTAYTSPDGVAWTQLGEPQTIAMTGSVLIGLAVCSHDPAIVTGADFSDVQTTGNVTGNWQLAAIGLEQPEGNSPEAVYVTVKDSSGKSKTIVNADSAATGRTGWQQWLIPLSDFSSAGVKMTAVKSIGIGVGNRTSPTAGGAGILYIDDVGYGRAAGQ